MAAYRRVDDLRSPAGWLPVHRDQLRTQRSVSSMGKPLSLPLLLYQYFVCLLKFAMGNYCYCFCFFKTFDGKAKLHIYVCFYGTIRLCMAWWCNSYGVGLWLKRSGVQLPAKPLSGNNLGQVVHTRSSVTKQYNLLPVAQQRCPATGKVTVGLVFHCQCITVLSALSTYGLKV